ncbi:AmpG permease [Bacteroidales bacterium CF]|jgi:Major Facilitator Superfamily./BT1 family.|nr:AmpG permease [Bacteroidales bacterium CF]
MMNSKKRSPWAWIPTLYFAQGLPYVAVMTVSVIMYKRLGISNTDIALYTSWLYLPWVIKPFWSPFIDLLKTKRWWVVAMQILVGAGLAGIAFTIPASNFFQLTLAVFWLIAFSSATHDIAADGFYMLALDSHDQAMYVGIRSTFYRIATITGQGLLIIIAGLLESSTGLKPAELQVNAGPQYASTFTLPAGDTTINATPVQSSDYMFEMNPPVVNLGTNTITVDSAAILRAYAVEHNIANGFVEAEKSKAQLEKEESWWTRSVSNPLGGFIKRNFGEENAGKEVHKMNGNAQLVAVKLSKAPAVGEKIVLNTSMKKGDKSIFLAYGDRITFTSENWDKPAYLLVQVDPKLDHETSASFKGLSGNISFAWSVTFFILAGFFLAIALYHKFILPKPASDKPAKEVTARNIFKEFFETFASFFKKKQIWIAIAFLLLYRLPEAQLVKLISPFLLDAREVGGMGLTTGQVGLVYGTIGILGLTLGGIIGGIIAAKGGLKKWLWPMAWSISLTCATFVYLSVFQPESLFVINLCVFVEQFGYGFGFTAYMLYMIYFAAGEHKTAHYAICTAFMALGMMMPGMMAGWLQELIGYENFFWWVMICCVTTIAVTAFIKVDDSFGRKQAEVKA